ncbi:MAG: hypothetical protein FD143_1777 [Ignavibacteria bacterium]|nr:MAG: hypothetical protein FD143_1777 [Ignavibacteria bacterium]KAF0160123.1 MAG: hypothetical protein FD188_1937 [Ignavibacteria bacterium]
MNFSNFIIEKLTETDSSLGLVNKKTASNPFLFADIIKVYEQENENKQNSVLGFSNSNQTQELFSANDTVVVLSEQDFLNLQQQVSELFSADDEIQLTETNHNVDNAEITKLQFVLHEEKLFKLAGDFLEKTGCSLIPFTDLSGLSSKSQPFSLSYKSGVNKISVAITPILVDETSTNKAIQDDFNFVNKLLADEGLMNNPGYFTHDIASSDQNKSAQELDLNGSSDLVDDEANSKLSDKVFYKAEIIKIESLVKLNQSFFPDQLKHFSDISITPKLSLPFRESVSQSDSSSEATAKKISLAQESFFPINKAAIEEAVNANIAASKNGSVDLRNLMEGLTVEEKSVFKNYETSGELKDVSLTKTFTNGNKYDLPKYNSEAVIVTPKQVGVKITAEQTLSVNNFQTSGTSENLNAKHINVKMQTEVLEAISLASLKENPISNSVISSNPAQLPIETAELNANASADGNPFEVFSDSKLHIKINSKANYKIESDVQSNLVVKHEVTSNTVETQPLSVEEETTIKETKIALNENQNKSKIIQDSVSEAEIISSTVKEKTVNQKMEVDAKEQINIQDKEAKVTSSNQQHSNGDKESGKSNTSEGFKNIFNQTLTTENSFDLENIKFQAEPKHSDTTFKTIKQQEILPEFSKMVLNGEKQTMTLQLTPENLGKVKLTVDMIDNQIITKIEVESEQVKQFVQSNLDQLKQNMQSAGIPLTNVNVSLSDEQKNYKLFAQRKKALSRDDKEDIIESVTQLNSKKQMGYNTYEFTA